MRVAIQTSSPEGPMRNASTMQDVQLTISAVSAMPASIHGNSEVVTPTELDAEVHVPPVAFLGEQTDLPMRCAGWE